MATKAERDRAKRDLMTGALAAARKAVVKDSPHVTRVPLDTTQGYVRLGSGFRLADEAVHVDYVLTQALYAATDDAVEAGEFSDDEMVEVLRKVLPKRGDGFFTRPDKPLDY